MRSRAKKQHVLTCCFPRTFAAIKVNKKALMKNILRVLAARSIQISQNREAVTPKFVSTHEFQKFSHSSILRVALEFYLFTFFHHTWTKWTMNRRGVCKNRSRIYILPHILSSPIRLLYILNIFSFINYRKYFFVLKVLDENYWQLGPVITLFVSR